MRLLKNEWYEIQSRIVRVAEEITIELSPNIQEIRVYNTIVESGKIVTGTSDTCIISFFGNPSDITFVNFWDLGSKLPWSVFRDLIVRYYSQEELLLEAKRRFPVGTKYYPAHLYNTNPEPDANFIVGQDQSFKLNHHSLNVDLYNPDKSYYSRDRNGHAYNQVLFHQGEWAKILSKSNNNQSMNEEGRLIVEAISKYPIGTKYIPLDSKGRSYSKEESTLVRRTPNGTSDHIEGGAGFLYVRGKWAEIVDEEDILAKARKEYPIGTRYKPIGSSGNLYATSVTVTREPNWHDSSSIEGGPGFIYYQGKWAQVVKTAENSIDYDAILQEALHRYPVGTNYYPLDGKGNKATTSRESVKKAVWFEKKVNNSSGTPQDLIEIGPGYAYVDGEWAELAKDNIDYDAVLEIAKRKYPKGTIYIPLSSEGNIYSGPKTSNQEAHWYNRKSKGEDADRIEIGYGFAYVDGKWAEVVGEAIPKKPIPTEEEVLRRYPKGTWYLPIHQGGAVGETPVQSEGNYGGGEDYLWVNKEIGTGYVYDIKNQKWADLIPNPKSDFIEPNEEQLIAEAYRRYPIGTKFKSSDDKGAIREVQPYKGHSAVVWALDRHGKLRADNGMFNDVYDERGRRNLCSNPHIYHKGVWAQIVHEMPIPVREYPMTPQDAYFPTEKLVARKEVLTKQSASQHKVEELPLLKIKKF